MAWYSSAISAILRRGLFISIDKRFLWTGLNVTKWKHFQPEEVEGLNESFVSKLDQARDLAQTPFRITSGKRTFLENEQIAGAVKDSAHLEGLAVDLYCFLSEERFRIVKALIHVGFNRLGIYKKHIHVDDSKTLPQNVFWYVDGD